MKRFSNKAKILKKKDTKPIFATTNQIIIVFKNLNTNLYLDLKLIKLSFSWTCDYLFYYLDYLTTDGKNCTFCSWKEQKKERTYADQITKVTI